MNIQRNIMLVILGITFSSLSFADRWKSLASNINTDTPPEELKKEVNDLLHQTFDTKK